MNILYLHGWYSVPGGVKPTHLEQAGYTVIQPVLPDDDFEQALRTAQMAYEQHRPAVIVGSSRGGAIAMGIKSESVPLVLLCPAWKRFGCTTRVKPETLILHALDDEVVPYQDSVDLLQQSGLDESLLIRVGHDHRLADANALQALQDAVAVSSMSRLTK
ncbi:MAG: hypothetical protein ACR2HF_08675 [Methylococcaceae bacterium]